jgi:hypothetical protein
MAKGDEHPRQASGTDDLLPTRRTLLSRLKDWEEHASWQEGFDIYWRLIHEVALKSGLTPVQAEEVVQETGRDRTALSTRPDKAKAQTR